MHAENGSTAAARPGRFSRMSGRTLSRSVEDYLKAIYGLQESGDAASTTAIAEALDIQPASVTGMIKRRHNRLQVGELTRRLL